MRRLSLIGILAIAALVAGGCIFLGISEKASLTVAQGTGPSPTLAEPNKTLLPTVNIAPAIGWPEGTQPTPANGLAVTSFADKLDHPRWLYVLPNGDVLVAESNAPPKPEGSGGFKSWVTGLVMKRAGARTPSANRITLLRDTNGDGVADHRSVFLENLYSPFGMTLVGSDFYVANANALMRFPYQPGADRIDAPGEKVVDLPAGVNHHWTKNVIASRDGTRLYITVGSNSNVGERGMEAEEGRAAIWELDRASGKMRLFATGLRNPNGLDWEPQTGALWTAVNERDEIGSDLVPDYITSVKDGGFYGWPYSYWGSNVDVRVKPPRPDLVAQAIAPDYALGPHTASLGIVFGQSVGLPAPYRDGLFVGQHGSWNRKPKSGYKVVFVPFKDGKPAGQPVDVLTGFLDDKEQALGRPVDVKGDGRGGLLVTDDVGNRIWRIAAGAR
ncbi:PQQ-dependent sugar dehydrogenase [Paracidovorax citrulli]